MHNVDAAAVVMARKRKQIEKPSDASADLPRSTAAERPAQGCKTTVALAAAVDRDEAAIRGMRRRGQWPPGIRDTPPWTAEEVAVIRDWVDKRERIHLEQRKRGDVEDDLKRARKRKIDLEVRILKKQYIKRDDVRRRWVSRVAAVRTGLLGLPRHVAPELVNKTNIDEIESILAARVRDLLYQYAGEVSDDADNGTDPDRADISDNA